MTNALNTLMIEVTQNDAASMRDALRDNLVNRAEYERAKNAENDSVQSTLNNVSKIYLNEHFARFALVCSLDAAHINKSERVNARLNVYTLDKIAALFKATCAHSKHNAFNAAIVASLVNFANSKSEAHFTIEHAKMSASKFYNCENVKANRKLLVRRDSVAASTASTQASSTMNALKACNAVTEYTNEGMICYRLNDNAIANALRESVASK